MLVMSTVSQNGDLKAASNDFIFNAYSQNKPNVGNLGIVISSFTSSFQFDGEDKTCLFHTFTHNFFFLYSYSEHKPGLLVTG